MVHHIVKDHEYVPCAVIGCRVCISMAVIEDALIDNAEDMAKLRKNQPKANYDL